MGETEIFEPICQGIAQSIKLPGHALLWGNTAAVGNRAEQASQLCKHWIDRHVAGVFFAPLEHVPGEAEINARIVAALSKAAIPLVLLDRDVQPAPQRSSLDLVSLDNRNAGYKAAIHLASNGRKRLGFLSRPGAAPSVLLRRAGYLDALLQTSLPSEQRLQTELEPREQRQVLDYLKSAKLDALVCANDRTAGELMQTLLRAGVHIPDDLALVGVDDVSYAGLLPVPLTTIRQPGRAIGQVALSTMLDRLTEPDLPPREVMLQGELVIRQSCGALR